MAFFSLLWRGCQLSRRSFKYFLKMMATRCCHTSFNSQIGFKNLNHCYNRCLSKWTRPLRVWEIFLKWKTSAIRPTGLPHQIPLQHKYKEKQHSREGHPYLRLQRFTEITFLVKMWSKPEFCAHGASLVIWLTHIIIAWNTLNEDCQWR